MNHVALDIQTPLNAKQQDWDRATKFLQKKTRFETHCHRSKDADWQVTGKINFRFSGGVILAHLKDTFTDSFYQMKVDIFPKKTSISSFGQCLITNQQRRMRPVGPQSGRTSVYRRRWYCHMPLNASSIKPVKLLSTDKAQVQSTCVSLVWQIHKKLRWSAWAWRALTAVQTIRSDQQGTWSINSLRENLAQWCITTALDKRQSYPWTPCLSADSEPFDSSRTILHRFLLFWRFKK